MTRLQYENDGDYQDFTLKMSIRDSKEHGITDASIGRIVMMYGPISKNGSGLAISDLGWGEFALLPAKYDQVLFPENAEPYQETLEELLADATGLTLEEIEEWMLDEEQEITDDGVLVGHIVNFRDDTPERVMSRVSGRTGEYTANVGIIDLDEGE
ncbi:hypothetical protein C1X21_13860 [Pseudomonas sp. FW305-3-2-15-A-LB2]|nr:hypothetical protein C1X22_14720 [Pseudomonas sp. DP16D-L5]PMV38793.1 hypothetical protein C1X21_13860 [Pseudomonas sp. FW305-3-2-15-A-LB2]PMV62697.1 hypothetical protein C1X20_14220 [Pseudomonas sp. FW305-3-2-15-C-LB3]PMV80165.1 hypothetical protein C1X14_12355 [Pseudomonas sp. FW305-3-2-15-C-TSA3]